MPEHCAAYSCVNRRTVASRARGITFHKFPKDKKTRKKWEVALRRYKFTASDSSVLCSEHFKQGDFDRTGQVVRLRDGVIPSVFSFPDHLKRPDKGRSTCTSRRAKESPAVASQNDPEAATLHSQPQPHDPGKSRSTSTSRRAKESLSVVPQDDPEASTSQPQPHDDHSYVLPACPTALKARLNKALARVEILEREKKNAMAWEKRAKTLRSLFGRIK